MKKEKENAVVASPRLIPTGARPIRFQLTGVKVIKADKYLNKIYKIRN